MKVAGIIILLFGLVLIIETSLGSFGDKVYNWSPVNGMVIMGIGALIYIANVKIRSSEVFPNPKQEKQFYL